MTSREEAREAIMAMLDEMSPWYAAAEGDPEHREQLMASIVKRMSAVCQVEPHDMGGFGRIAGD